MIQIAALMLLISSNPEREAPTSKPAAAAQLRYVAMVEFPALRPKPAERPFRQRAIASPRGGGGTPLVMVFEKNGRAALAPKSAEAFEFEPGLPAKSLWPTAQTPWLVRDLNRNGRIESGRELFGSFTLTDTGLAEHGFEALSALDSNADGFIDASDAAFASLSLWRDRNLNRRTDADELVSLTQAGVTRIALSYVSRRQCDALGNCEVERASFDFVSTDGRSRVGTVIDVHLVLQHAPMASPP